MVMRDKFTARLYNEWAADQRNKRRAECDPLSLTLDCPFLVWQ
jgi:hypothetical protein